ncbi:SpvB/TcaC N-terminal domain-containing protein [Desulfonatronum parangueonense]
MTQQGTAKNQNDGEQQPAVPSISLPKGGGAIRGIGEKFAANPVTGTGSLSVPIATSPGRSEFGPQLSLSYDSGSGNGPFGLGWSLSLPAITRKTEKGLPLYNDATESDVFILSGSEDLVPVLKTDGSRFCDNTTAHGYEIHRYRPRIEGLFARIERWTNSATGETHWRSISRENVTTLYGKDNNSRISDPADPDPAHPTRIFSWLICQSYDDKGNAMVYEYAEENDRNVDRSQANERNRVRTANRYLKRIKYGNRRPNRQVDTWQVINPDELPDETWMFEMVLDYDEGHYGELPLDPALAEDEQHRFVHASPSVGQTWADRPDPFSSYRAGFEVRTYRLCQRVLMFHHIPDLPTGKKGYDGLVRSTSFEYCPERDRMHAKNPVYSRLVAVTQSGYNRQEDGSYLRKSLPQLEFKYSDPVLQDIVKEVTGESLENLPVGLDGVDYQWTDLHGEGIPGILTEQAGAWFYKRNLSPLPVPGNGPETVKARFSPVEAVAVKPNLALTEGAQFMDLAGDGLPDLVVMDGPMSGLYEHDGDEGWQPFRPFTARLNRDMRDPNLKFIDLDGDGHADVLITEDEAFVWHASLAEEGFGPARRVAQALDEEKGPRLVFADATQSVYLADLSGDGLTDLVRIRNGEVCYWPNLGYGRFGAKVTMDHAPHFDNPDQFGQQRIRLADIDGTGTTDIIYLHRDGVRLYFNQSGNSWSEPQILKIFPPVDDLVRIMPVDLLGNGTACLVWSSPLPGDAGRQLRYVELLAEGKPHLLIRTTNNLGAETRIHYAPSTRFYLQDKQDGQPWITRLPFPVHVVERVETYDYISRNRFVTRYTYHHGYFDGEEREFRGFGRVEQWDTEDIGALVPDGEEEASNWDAAFQMPPVHTKTWFHTGVWLDRDHISRQFEAEYFREPGLYTEELRALLLPDTHLPDGLTVEEEREACRALKGQMLRQEVYADDAGPDASEEAKERASRPYSVVEQDFTIRPLQARVDNRHAVFFTHPREVITYHYERNPADPRIQHALTLEVDDYGNVLKEAAIGYGRRENIREVDEDGTVRQLPNPGLAELAKLGEDDQAKQTTALLTYTEHCVTNALDTPDTWRSPLPCEVLTYELTGFTPTGPASRFRSADFVEPDPNHPGRLSPTLADEVAYEEDVTANPCRRLIERIRTLYRPNDCGVSQNDPLALLPLGELQSLALPGESYQLAFTPGLLDRVFRRDGTPLLPDAPSVLGGTDGDQGGYVDLDSNDHWWIPSGRVLFSPDPDASPEAEQAQARANFFLPRRYRDPFGQHNFVDFDDHDLLMVETRDALGNCVTVGENDYRVLQPSLVSDPNRNRTEVAFDALGMVVGTAVMGKPEPAPVEGDLLTGFVTDITRAELDRFMAEPRRAGAKPGESEAAPTMYDMLQQATTRNVYDLDRFVRLGEPVFAATIARETHVSDLKDDEASKLQISFSYSDGFGREVQKKIQTEPGPFDVDDPHSPTANPRWVGSGWIIFNNKGNPVRQYEPFFSKRLRPDGTLFSDHRFEFGAAVGVSPVLFYDPAERVIATLHPNHTYEKVVFDPWKQTTWDVNDTCAARNQQTGDPRTDPDIRGYVDAYFNALPNDPSRPWQTWYKQRHGGALGTEEQKAAQKAAIHANTPTTAHLDTLGRPFLTSVKNRVTCPNHTDGKEEDIPTCVELDIEGNQRSITDALGRVVMKYDYMMAGPPEEEDGPTNLIHQHSMEAGERWMLNDIYGNPIRAWDSRGFVRRMTYDKLRRPLGLYVTGADPANPGMELLCEKMKYGEDVTDESGNLIDTHLNLRTRVIKQYDEAGIATLMVKNLVSGKDEGYDFKGNLLRSQRQLLKNYKKQSDWQFDQDVEPEVFVQANSYDALNRVISSTAPDKSIVRFTYNDANLLEKVDTNLQGKTKNNKPVWTPFVKNIDYDAKGQRKLIEYGNEAITRYEYDPFTFRLTHLFTTRGAGFPQACETKLSDGDRNQRECPKPQPRCKALQNLYYTYDPTGNITHIHDDAQQTVFFRNKCVEPSADYTYDAIYRLIEATGREHLGQVGGAPISHSYNDAPHVGLLHPGDGKAMGNYLERYVYDAVGNFLEMQHRGIDPEHPGWTRRYTYNENSLLETGKKSNRLSSSQLGNGINSPPEIYTYDAHGNMLCMPHLEEMQWDFRDQLQMTQRQKVNDEDIEGTQRQGERTWYVYDSAGQRVRKITDRQAQAGQTPTKKEEHIYLGGFEIYRKYENDGKTAASERETVHITDDQQRIALVETQTVKESAAVNPFTPLQRYQLGNHLGSASLELDDKSRIISYEEYTPYGSTSYQAVTTHIEVSAKRYRYTGKERDEESGLYYHGARYYASWLGRWTSCDPAGLVDGLNMFAFVQNNPIIYVDPIGEQAEQSRAVCMPIEPGDCSGVSFDILPEADIQEPQQDLREPIVFEAMDLREPIVFEAMDLREPIVFEVMDLNLGEPSSINLEFTDISFFGGKKVIFGHKVGLYVAVQEPHSCTWEICETQIAQKTSGMFSIGFFGLGYTSEVDIIGEVSKSLTIKLFIFDFEFGDDHTTTTHFSVIGWKAGWGPSIGFDLTLSQEIEPLDDYMEEVRNRVVLYGQLGNTRGTITIKQRPFKQRQSGGWEHTYVK